MNYMDHHICCWKSSHYTQSMQWEFKYYLYIYNGYIYCARWIATGNLTMEWVYRVVDHAFPTGTRKCNFRHDMSQVINSTSNFKPVYCVNMQTRNTDECIKWFISCTILFTLLPCPFRNNECNIHGRHAFGTGTRHELPAQLRLSIRSQHINCSVNIISKGSIRTNQCCWHRRKAWYYLLHKINHVKMHRICVQFFKYFSYVDCFDFGAYLCKSHICTSIHAQTSKFTARLAFVIVTFAFAKMALPNP